MAARLPAGRPGAGLRYVRTRRSSAKFPSTSCQARTCGCRRQATAITNRKPANAASRSVADGSAGDRGMRVVGADHLEARRAGRPASRRSGPRRGDLVARGRGVARLRGRHDARATRARGPRAGRTPRAAPASAACARMASIDRGRAPRRAVVRHRSHRRSRQKRPSGPSVVQRRGGRRAHRRFGRVLGDLAQHQARRRDLDHRQFGDDEVDHAPAR